MAEKFTTELTELFPGVISLIIHGYYKTYRIELINEMTTKVHQFVDVSLDFVKGMLCGYVGGRYWQIKLIDEIPSYDRDRDNITECWAGQFPWHDEDDETNQIDTLKKYAETSTDITINDEYHCEGNGEVFSYLFHFDTLDFVDGMRSLEKVVGDHDCITVGTIYRNLEVIKYP